MEPTPEQLVQREKNKLNKSYAATVTFYFMAPDLKTAAEEAEWVTYSPRSNSRSLSTRLERLTKWS